MPKAACCCNVCEWCDHNHDTIDWYNPDHLWYNSGNLEQCKQPNWNVLGTLTTEIPSVGHPMPKFICRSNVGTGPSEIDTSCAQNPDCPPFNCVRGKNLDTYGKYVYDTSTNQFGGTSYFRSPSQLLNTESYFWGSAAFYGEIYPCWFNGLNMTNIENDSDEFIKFTFKLTVEKFIGSTGNSGASGASGTSGSFKYCLCGCSGAAGSTGCDGSSGASGASGSTGSNPDYQTVLNLSFSGVGKNLHPHPDACSSYNVASSDFDQWINLTECYDFHTTDSNGFYIPCVTNFAKMPRGPWPYRFKRNIQPDTNLEQAGGFEFPCRALYPDGGPGGYPYTKEQVLRAREDPSFIGSEILDEDGNVIGIIGENILYCPLEERPCSGEDPDIPGGSFFVPTGPGGNDSGNDEEQTQGEQCCTQSYCSNKEICYELDEEGTPFGWEDVPTGCSGMSNYGSSDENRRFFCWWDPSNRYTTPEWDVTDTAANEKRKLSIHVVVPTKMFRDTGDGFPTGFCYPSYGEQGRSFGEWSFGMDLESINGEIDKLDRAGFVWSNGREDDGIWINRTPTNALRVLFTMDHSDLAQGKVWRVFRDWDAKTCGYIEKVFNAGTPEETRFRIKVEQKVEEINFSSLGCDCPSGYMRAGPTGNTGPTGASGASGASGYSGYTGPTGAYVRILPSSCDDAIKSCDIPIPGTTMFIPGSTVDNSLHCMNDFYGEGSKISFAERGPIVLNVDVETKGFGCVVCNASPIDYENCECSSTIGGTTRVRENTKLNGLKMVLHSFGDPLPQQVDILGRGVFWWAMGAWPSAVDPAYLGTFNSKYFGNVDTGILEGTCPQVYADPSTGLFQPAPPAVYDIFKEHGRRWIDTTADLPFPSGSPASPMGGLRYRNSYVGVSVPSTLELDYLEGRLAACGDPLYGESRCQWVSICPPTSDPVVRTLNTHPVFNEKAEDFPSEGPIGKCNVACSVCPLGLPILPCDDDGKTGSSGGGPTPCPCCDLELYYSTDPPGLNCPPVPEGSNCDPDPLTGLQPRCSEDGSPYCRCTECVPQPDPDDGCPHLVDENEVGVGFGQFIYTDWGCSRNVVSPTGRAGEAGCYDCGDSANRGSILNTCFGSILNVNRMFGMDSERLYFRSDGSNSAVGHLGNYECKDYVECGCPTNASSNCLIQNCIDGVPTEYINYCRASASTYSWAFGDITVNWRKYLCQQRTEDYKLFEPNIIEKLKFECNSDGGDCNSFNYMRDYENLPDACKHIWRTLNGSCDGQPNTGGLSLFYEAMCGIGSYCTERPVGIKIELSKFEVPDDDRGWLPFDTTYAPNPNRSLLAKNRCHIIITPKGKIY